MSGFPERLPAGDRAGALAPGGRRLSEGRPAEGLRVSRCVAGCAGERVNALLCAIRRHAAGEGAPP